MVRTHARYDIDPVCIIQTQVFLQQKVRNQASPYKHGTDKETVDDFSERHPLAGKQISQKPADEHLLQRTDDRDAHRDQRGAGNAF